MIGCSVYLRGDRGAVAKFALQLNMAGSNIHWAGVPIADYSFYDRHENNMKVAEIGGDFNFMCDINLFDTPQELLIDRLRIVSGFGLVLAIPDDSSESPLDYIIFEDGQTKEIVLLQDDLLEEVRIFQPKQESTPT